MKKIFNSVIGSPIIMFKIDLKMRLFFLLFTCALFNLQANTGYAQKAKIDLSMTNASISEIIEAIEAKTEFRFFYSKEEIALDQKLDIQAKQLKIDKVLEKVFNNKAISYKILDKQIILKPQNEVVPTTKSIQVKASDKQQAIELSGVILDESGVPLVGANIVEKGTRNGTQTDFDGNFSLEVASQESILQISYVGFTSQEIAVGSQTQFDIVMIEDAASLDEVVVVGYGKQKRASITGSVATVQSEDLVRTPTTNVTQSLAGRLPGLVVTQNNGQPGGDQANISIRGFGNALVIVDGVPRDFQQLDPNEIESISILKDASAAVYGALAGNGVILVTTKRGKIGAPKINYSGAYTFSAPTFLPQIADAASYARYIQTAERLEGVAEADLTFSNDDVARWAAGTENGFIGTDWQDLVLKDWADTEQHNINVQGGTEKVKYFASIGKLNQGSLLESGDGRFERYNIGSTLDAQITKRLNVGINLKYREEATERPSGLEGDNDSYTRIFRFLAQMNPAVQLNPDPTLLTSAHPLESNAVAYSTRSITGINDTKRKQFDLILNFDYDIPFVEGLEFNGTIAHQTVNTTNALTRLPFTTFNHDFETGVSTPAFTTADDLVRKSSNNFTMTTTQVGLSYAKELEDHKISARLLVENRYIDNSGLRFTRTQLLSPNNPLINGAIGSLVPGDGDFESQVGRQGVVGRLNYEYKERYLLEALFRADANIQFPENSRWGYFPGVSLGWIVSKEDFLKNSSTLDFLKFRTSFSSLGFDGTSNFDFLTGFSIQQGRSNSFIYGPTIFNSTLRTVGLANPTITWENMDTYNFGIDARLWNNKLGIEFDIFYRRRSGLLETREEALPDTFGADLPEENLEVRDNRGFELVLNHRSKIGELNIDVSGNVTWTREKFITEVEREFDLDDPDDARLNQRSGQWVNRRFGYRTNGFYNTQEEIDNDGITHDPSIGEPVVGDVRYVDRNGDGNIDFRDQEVIGRNQTPELFFGLSLNADYKGFDFSMLWQGASNFDVQLSDPELSPNTSIGFIPFQYIVDNAWNPENPSAARLPAPNTGGLNLHNDQSLDIYQRDGTYLRLKQIALGYSIPTSILEKVNIKKARVYVAGYNLLTIRNTGIFDFDPEARGNDGLATYPVQKNISLGINIGL